MTGFIPPIVVTLWCIAYYCVSKVVILNWWTFTVTGTSLYAVYTFFMFTMMYTYYLAVTTRPGSVPSDYDESQLEIKQKYPEFKFKTRYCSTCEQYKPPRSHHCSDCGECVLRMDHHCPWVNNCVGHYNYQPFFLFLIYTMISCALNFVLMIWRLSGALDNMHMSSRRYRRRHVRTSTAATSTAAVAGVSATPTKAAVVLNTTGSPSLSVIDGICIAITIVVALAFFLGVLCLFCWHVTLVLKNSTTIDSYREVESIADNADHTIGLTYNLGAMRNVTEILGPYYIWPGPVKGDGLNYPTRTIALDPSMYRPRDSASTSSRSKRSRRREEEFDSDDGREFEDIAAALRAI